MSTKPAEITFWLGLTPYRQAYFDGETLLQTARRARAPLSSNCEKGECAACMVRIRKGNVTMARNEVLSEDEISLGYTLGCQAVPVSEECEVEFV